MSDKIYEPIHPEGGKCRDEEMTILPLQINGILKQYSKLASTNQSPLEESLSEVGEVEDIVNISTEAKRRQVHEQTKIEVMRKVKESG